MCITYLSRDSCRNLICKNLENNFRKLCRLKALVQAAQLVVIGEAGTYLASWPAGLGNEHR